MISFTRTDEGQRDVSFNEKKVIPTNICNKHDSKEGLREAFK